MIEQLLPKVRYGGVRTSRNQIFRAKPHSTWDNYFSGDIIFDWLGRNGFGATMTCRRDRLPHGVPEGFLCKKTTPPDARSKAARFNQPICLVKTTPEYERLHVTFQSTSSCNIATVNALNSCQLFVRVKKGVLVQTNVPGGLR